MSIWVIERLRCFLQGHRALSQTQSYGGILPHGRSSALHFCLACNSVVWVNARSATREKLTWNNLQI